MTNSESFCSTFFFYRCVTEIIIYFSNAIQKRETLRCSCNKQILLEHFSQVILMIKYLNKAKKGDLICLSTLIVQVFLPGFFPLTHFSINFLKNKSWNFISRKTKHIVLCNKSKYVISFLHLFAEINSPFQSSHSLRCTCNIYFNLFTFICVSSLFCNFCKEKIFLKFLSFTRSAFAVIFGKKIYFKKLWLVLFFTQSVNHLFVFKFQSGLEN